VTTSLGFEMLAPQVIFGLFRFAKSSYSKLQSFGYLNVNPYVLLVYVFQLEVAIVLDIKLRFKYPKYPTTPTIIIKSSKIIMEKPLELSLTTEM